MKDLVQLVANTKCSIASIASGLGLTLVELLNIWRIVRIMQHLGQSNDQRRDRQRCSLGYKLFQGKRSKSLILQLLCFILPHFSCQVLCMMICSFALMRHRDENDPNLVRLVAPIEFIKSTTQRIDKTDCHRDQGC